MSKNNIKSKVFDNQNYFNADPSCNIIIPAEVASRLGVSPRDNLRYTESGNTLTLRLPMRLSKLYVEVTNYNSINRNNFNLDLPLMDMNDFEEIRNRYDDNTYTTQTRRNSFQAKETTDIQGANLQT